MRISFLFAALKNSKLLEFENSQKKQGKKITNAESLLPTDFKLLEPAVK
jgi:hypothetical protein